MLDFDPENDPELFDVEAHRIDLAAPLLVLRARGGVLACGYLNLPTMNKFGEVGAIVTGVAEIGRAHV